VIYPYVLNVTLANGSPGIATPAMNSVITFNPAKKKVE
jgi:hypothetical protein